MPTVTAYRNGSTAGIGGGNKSPVKRSIVKGWSTAAVRRHTKWLYSIDAPALTGAGFALTLTMKNTPPSSEAFHAMRDAYFKRLTRLGVTRYHWVVEWQRRGTPHLHVAAYFGDADSVPGESGIEDLSRPAMLITNWILLASEYGATIQAQDYKPIDGALGWLAYLSKHAARGVKHYQRMGHPVGWEKTGRLWGYGGEWPTDKPMQFDMSREAYWRYRRLVRSWTIANARQSGKASRIAYSRRMLSCNLPKLSAVRGVSGWLPEPVTLELVSLLQAEGYEITQRVE